MSLIRKTQEKFIEQSIKLHGNLYDYSKVQYVGYSDKVCIVCPRHGEFFQKPAIHLSPAGCPKCAIERRTKGKDQLIKDFMLAHDRKYDYSKIQYRDISTKICIVCPDHGEFWQEPGSHRRGVGCPHCYEVKRTKTGEGFIKDAIQIHGNKYDYSKLNYTGNHNKVCIVCLKHGEFWMSAGSHLHGRNCPKCSLDGRTRTKADFIEEATKIHGHKYDYSKVVYTNIGNKVCMICPKHGEFWQIANNHLHGRKCAKCRGVVLKDGVLCGSLAEAYLYLKYKEKGISFLHNKMYGKALGQMRYDFHFPSLNLYEEVTSYNFKAGMSYREKAIKDFYLYKIQRKKNFVEKQGGTFKFIELRLNKEQRDLVLANSIQ